MESERSQWMQFCELSRQEYEVFQKNQTYRCFLNGVETVDLKNAEGYEGIYVGVKENHQLLCATTLIKMPCMKKFHFYYAPRGFLMDYRNEELLTFFTKELKAYAKQRGIIYVLFDPYIEYKERDGDGKLVENGFDNSDIVENLIQHGYQHKGFSEGYGHNMQWIRWTYTMPLKGETKDTLWKKLQQQTRYSINKTLRYQMQVKELSYEELPLFDEIMKKTAERRNFDTRDLAFFQKQYKAYQGHLKTLLAYLDVSLYRKALQGEEDALLADKAKLTVELEEHPNSKKHQKRLRVVEETLGVMQKRFKEADEVEQQYGNIIPMAASMFMMYDDEVTYLFSGAYEEFRGFYAPYAIQWHMIQEAIDKGYERYNFYGISGDFHEASPDYGVYKFKRGFPGNVNELIGDFVLPVKPSVYKLLQTLGRGV